MVLHGWTAWRALLQPFGSGCVRLCPPTGPGGRPGQDGNENGPCLHALPARVVRLPSRNNTEPRPAEPLADGRSSSPNCNGADHQLARVRIVARRPLPTETSGLHVGAEPWSRSQCPSEITFLVGIAFAASRPRAPQGGPTPVWGQVPGDRRPLAARAQTMHHAIQHGAHVHRAPVAAPLGRRKQRRTQRPLRIHMAARVAQRAPVIPASLLNSPHPQTRPGTSGPIQPQPPSNAQDDPG